MTNRIAVKTTSSAVGTSSLTIGFTTELAPVGSLILIGVNTSGHAPATPIGWTLEASVATGTAGSAGGCALYIYSRVRQSGDSTNVTFTYTSDYGAAVGIALVGQHPTTWLDTAIVTDITDPASQTFTLEEVTTTTDNVWIVGFIGVDTDSGTLKITGPLTNGTVVDEVLQTSRATTSGTGGQVYVQTGQLVSPGATGALTRTETTTAAVSVSATVAIRPAEDTILRVYQSTARVVRTQPEPKLRVYQSTVRVVRSSQLVPPPVLEQPRINIAM